MTPARQGLLVPKISERQAALAGPRDLKQEGSPEWCWQTVYLLQRSCEHMEEQWARADQFRLELAEQRAWERIPPEHPYGSEDAMLRAEIGASLEQFRSRVITAQE